jgi:hypothetical protein
MNTFGTRIYRSTTLWGSMWTLEWWVTRRALLRYERQGETVGAEVGVRVVGDVVGARDAGTRLCNVQCITASHLQYS